MPPKKKDDFLGQTRQDGACLLWTGRGFGDQGYGLYVRGEEAGQNRRILAHREAFERGAGYTPEYRVLQTCGRKRCVEFSHLVDAGTLENQRKLP